MSISAHDITIPGDLKGCQILLRELAQTITGKDESIACKDESIACKDESIACKDESIACKDETIACKDRTIDIQSQTITLLEQEKEELQLAFNKLLQRAFGNRSERYLDNPDQLRLDFKDSDEAADAALGLADAVEDLQQTIPQHQRRIHEVFTRALANNQPSIHAHMWAYRGTTVKLNVFDFTVSRHRDGPELFFADYQGTLLGDCWSGFEAITVASAGNI